MMRNISFQIILIVLLSIYVQTQILRNNNQKPPPPPPVVIPGIQQQPQSQTLFTDDEPLLAIQQTASNQTQGTLQLKIKPLRQNVNLCPTTQIMPAMVSLKSSGGKRSYVDLICVLDVSGSMSGQKIKLMKDTMKYLVQLLSPNDRLSIVKFSTTGQRLTPLKRVYGQNTQEFLKIIDGLKIQGGTNIMSGANIALKILRDRKHINQVSSIFLLSDGEDNIPGAVDRMRNALKSKKNSDLSAFSIHTFGFGADHDERLMSQFALLKDGSFYFIKDYQNLDITFSNSLGAIFSVVANNVVIDIKEQEMKIPYNVKIKKVYGNSWTKIADGHYQIRLTQMMAQTSKNYVFQLQLPSTKKTIKDEGSRQAVLQGKLNTYGINGQKITQVKYMNMLFVNCDDPQVLENYYRILGAQIMEQSLRLGEQEEFQEARDNVDDVIRKITSNQKIRQDKMKSLLQDLRNARQKLTPQSFRGQGKKSITSASTAHYSQTNIQYASMPQMMMNEQTLARRPRSTPTITPPIISPNSEGIRSPQPQPLQSPPSPIKPPPLPTITSPPVATMTNVPVNLTP